MIERCRRARKVLLVGIDGLGGSGKSTLARALQQLIRGASVIEFDDFYRPSGTRLPTEQAEIGGAFEWERLRDQVLRPLSDNQTAEYQRYDWDTDAMAEWHTVPAHGVIVVEGTYSTREELRGFYDFRIWVEAQHEVRLGRGVERDGEESRHRWLHEWMPDEEQYAAAQEPRRFAHVIIDGGPHEGIDPSRAYIELQ